MYKKNDYSAYAYVLPAASVLLIFHIFPVIYSFMLSVHQGTLKHPMKTYIGVGNYAAILEDVNFWKSMLNTVWFALSSVPMGIIIALAIAMLLNQKIKGLAIYRTVYYLPVVTSIAAVALVWKWLFDVKFGLFNQIIQWAGLKPMGWLQDSTGVFEFMASIVGLGIPETYLMFEPGFMREMVYGLMHGPSIALCSITIMSIWKGLGYNVVIFLAGLQNIPQGLYEAAEIDGANAWHKFKNVTWPLLAPTTFFVFIMSTISSFQVFVQIFMMTPFGGPERSTSVAVFYLYEKAFKTFEFGYASALAYVVFFVIFIMTLVQRKLGDGQNHQGV